MATLQEMQRELAEKRTAHAQRFEAIKRAPEPAKHQGNRIAQEPQRIRSR